MSPISMKLSQYIGSTPKLRKTNWFRFLIFQGGGRSPPLVLQDFCQTNALILAKCMKLSEQPYSTDCYQVLHTYWYIYSKCKNQVTVYLISRLSINGQKYVTVFLGLQIFDDFEVKYLPLPKRSDTNLNVPLSIDHLSLKNS